LPAPQLGAGEGSNYEIVDVWGTRGERALPPTRLHLYQTDDGYRLVGLERPTQHLPPSG
jgi:hypothetical protein